MVDVLCKICRTGKYSVMLNHDSMVAVFTAGVVVDFEIKRISP